MVAWTFVGIPSSSLMSQKQSAWSLFRECSIQKYKTSNKKEKEEQSSVPKLIHCQIYPESSDLVLPLDFWEGRGECLHTYMTSKTIYYFSRTLKMAFPQQLSLTQWVMDNIETYSYLVFGPMVVGHSTSQDLLSMFPFANACLFLWHSDMSLVPVFFHLFPFLLLKKKKKGHSVSQSGFRPGNPKNEEEEKVLETRLGQVDIKIMKTQNREGRQSVNQGLRSYSCLSTWLYLDWTKPPNVWAHLWGIFA